MRKRRFFLLLIAGGVLVIVAVVVFSPSREREPEYGGKRLSEWVFELPPDASQSGNSAAEVALREIGTKALPYLLEWISYEPAPWRLKIYEIAGKLLQKGPNVIFQDRKMLRASCAVRAFGTVGLQDEGITTQLKRMSQEPNRGVSRLYIIFALNCGGAHGFPHYGPGTMRGTSYSGSDAFSLAYQTNGVPILTVSHTNTPLAPPAALNSGGKAQGRENTVKK